MLSNQTKKGLQGYASVIPTPTPERPGDRLEDMIAQSRFLGEWGAALLILGVVWGSPGRPGFSAELAEF